MQEPIINETLKQKWYDEGWWTKESLIDNWNETVKKHPYREFITEDSGARYTYAEIDDLAGRVASYMADMGVKPGDTVSFQLPIWVEAVIITIGAWKVGAVVSPIALFYNHDDVRTRLQLNECAIFFCPTFYYKTDFEVQVDMPNAYLPHLKHVVLIDRERPRKRAFVTLREIFQIYRPYEESITVDADSVAAILFTSGTTGDANGVMLTHNNLRFAELEFARELDLTGNDVMFMPSPLNHAIGFQHGILCVYLLGARLVLQQRFNAPDAIALINEEKCTYSMGATPFVFDILEQLDKTGETLPTMRFYLSGGAHVPSSMIQWAWKHNILLAEVYGSTESTPHSFVPIGEVLSRNGTVSGRPVHGSEVRIVDDSGREVAEGEEGEEQSRGPQVFVGYAGRPEAAKRVLDEDGWYHSGDLATRFDHGFYRISGRIKDIIIRGGENLNSATLNANLEQMPKIREHEIVGMPDDRLGERICAYVTLAEGADELTLDELLAWMKERNIPKWQWPEHLEVVDELPYTDTGKVKKYLLREDIAAKVNQDK